MFYIFACLLSQSEYNLKLFLYMYDLIHMGNNFFDLSNL